jgi:DNA-binding XRE family transcriptional regulator
MDNNFQERLIEFRKKVANSASAFARSIEQLQPAYVKYERGERKPAFEILEKMARVHNVNLNWLLTGEGEMFMTQPTLKVRDEDKKIALRNFGGKINKLQTENDLSLSEAAEILEISEDDFVDYCLNRKKPDINIILKIIEKFDVNFEWFIK